MNGKLYKKDLKCRTLEAGPWPWAYPKPPKFYSDYFLLTPQGRSNFFQGGGGADGPIPTETNRTSEIQRGGGLDHLTPLWICACAL